MQFARGHAATQVPLRIQTWRFGKDLTVVALSGEVGGDYALRMKKELDADRIWRFAFANEPCYIPSGRGLREGGYGA